MKTLIECLLYIPLFSVISAFFSYYVGYSLMEVNYFLGPWVISSCLNGVFIAIVFIKLALKE